MKVLCKHCENPCKKIGKVECEDYKKISISDLEKEKRDLYKSGKNPKRLQEIIDYLDWIYWGIKK